MAMAPVDYEALPYSSMPFPLSQPTHLAALAALHSRSAPPVATARVLELGCASGGNLIPLAARFPDAVFEGVDLSARHVEEGRALVRDLGLSNIAIRQGDIAALDLSGREFDYIICHGVFSWAPKAVQENIFRICAEHLGANGVAYVSYNVLPGWHFQLVVRDICLRYAGVDGPPQLQIARARAALEQLAQLADDKGTFGKVLREEVQRSARMNDSHFLGEFLSAHNDPCHVEEFMARAEKHGLSYLCDAGLADGLPDSLGPERSEQVRKVAGGGRLATLQCMDHVSGRTFRRSLLVKGTGSNEPAIGAGSLAQLHFCCPLSLEVSTDGAFLFRRDQAQLKTNDPVVGSALTYLADAYPETRSCAEIVAHLSAQAGRAPQAFSTRLSDALLRTVVAGHLIVSSLPLRVAQADEERPTLWPLARAQLRRGQTWVSNLLHLPIQMPPAARFVAALLDGVHTANQIEARLAAAIAKREIVIDGMEASSDAAAQRQAAERLLQTMLRELRRSALLSPRP